LEAVDGYPGKNLGCIIFSFIIFVAVILLAEHVEWELL